MAQNKTACVDVPTQEREAFSSVFSGDSVWTLENVSNQYAIILTFFSMVDGVYTAYPIPTGCSEGEPVNATRFSINPNESKTFKLPAGTWSLRLTSTKVVESVTHRAMLSVLSASVFHALCDN